ncbi:hypothetical protein O997_02735 [Anaplasma phagocytophilum str. MRK]|nr:hypothetical protein O997_02735 [Anaplasma phagocytophilum str. MRK]
MLLDLKHPAFKRDLSKVRRRGLDRHLNAVCALRYYMQKIATPYFRDAVFIAVYDKYNITYDM